MDVVHQVLDQLEILLLHRAGLPRNLLRSLAECVLVLDTGSCKNMREEQNVIKTCKRKKLALSPW